MLSYDKTLNSFQGVPILEETSEKVETYKIEFKGEDKMEVSEMEKLGNEAGVSLDDIPEIFTATWVSDETKIDDQYGVKVLSVQLDIKEVGMAKFTFKPSHIKFMTKSLKGLNINNPIGKTFEFKKEKFKIGFPRPFPTKVVE